MRKELYTIGFTRKTLEQFIALLKQANVQTVVDIRLRNTSQIAGWAKYPDISYMLREGFGIGYEHQLEFAPTDAMFDRYKLTKNWNEYETAFRELIRNRKPEAEARELLQRTGPCLLCTEPEADRCHRRLVAEYFVELFPELEVIHL